MSTYNCAKGCRDPKTESGRMSHYSTNECPFETYNPNIHPGRPGKMRAKGHPGPGAAAPAQPAAQKPSAPIPPPASSATINVVGGQAAVTKGAPKPIVVPVDYIVDGEHTKALWNFGFRVLYFIHVKVDEWAFDWHQHIPKVQFQLTPNAEMSISISPRNLYSRAATWFTKNLCGAKTLEQAHAAIDSILFFEAFGGIFVAIVLHYEHVYKNSPKMKARREAKRLRLEALKAQREGRQVIVSRTGEVSQGVPVYASAGVVA